MEIISCETRTSKRTSQATKTSGTSSSHMHKVTMVEGEKTWNAPMFSDKELPQGIPNNTSSSGVSSGKIKMLDK